MDRNELREPTFLILASVAARPRHGYAIKRAIAELSDGRLEVGTGTIYSALDRLVADGIVVESSAEIVNGRLRRYYVLTDAGAALLEARIQQLRMHAAHAEGQLRARHAG